MKKIVLPTYNAPLKKIVLTGSIKIKSNKKVKISKQKGSTQYFDSIIVQYDNEEEFKNWLIFHSFIFDDLHSIDQFENNAEITELKEKCSGEIEYSNIKKRIYFPEDKDVDKEEISYDNLYAKFLKIEKCDRDLLINYLLNFSGGLSTQIDPIRDYSYWQIFDYYSIYESIIGEQPSDCEGFSCPKCKKELPGHRSLTEMEWNKKRLSEIIKEPDLVSEYLKIVQTVRDNIRHKTAHSGLHPTAKYIAQSEAVVKYDADRSRESFKDDATALLALKLNMKDVVRFLLLDKLFGLGLFPYMRSIVTHTIFAKPSGKKSKPES